MNERQEDHKQPIIVQEIVRDTCLFAALCHRSGWSASMFAGSGSVLNMNLWGLLGLTLLLLVFGHLRILIEEHCICLASWLTDAYKLDRLC